MAGVKRQTTWIDTDVNIQAGAGGAQGTPVTLLSNRILAADIAGKTIIRMLVDLSIHPTVPSSIFGGQVVTIGAGIITTDAFLANSLPDLNAPDEEPIRGWIFKNTRFAFDSENSFQYDRLSLDLRSQRKLDLDTEVYINILNTDMTGTAFAVEVTGLVRMLVKLP